MPKGQTSTEEHRRLAEIAALDLEAARPGFDRIARLAQCQTGAPVVQISLVQADSLWRAGVSDVDIPIVAREHAFSDIVIREGALVWVEDLTKDARFAGNPYVTGATRFRSYVGAPIRLSNGQCVGALSVIDRKTRPHDAAMAARVADFAALVADDWERRRLLSAAKAREAEVRAVGNTLATVIEAAPVAIAMTDSNLTILRASQRWRERAGAWVEGDVVGRSMHEVAPDSDNAAYLWETIRAECAAGRSLKRDRARFVAPDGVTRWVCWEIAPWTDAAGGFGGMLVMVNDITDMVEALERSEAAEQRLRLAADMAGISVWEIDLRGNSVRTEGAISIYNDQSDALPPGADVSERIWSSIHAVDRPGVVACWEKHLEDRTPFRSVHRQLQLNGPHVWVMTAAEALRGVDGEVERVVGVTKNIDKEKRAEKAMAKALDAAEAANRAKSEFLANMSHEIRTPLNGVMGIAGALSRTELKPAQREMVEVIESSAGLLDSLLSDVLDIARIEAGRLELVREPFDLGAALKGVAALFKPKAEEKGLAFEARIAPVAEAKVTGDAVRLRQVVTNLLSNAVKFTEAGQVTLQVEAERTLEMVKLKLVVRDTGIGFDAKAGARLFRRFEQADGSTTRRFGGTGLGLAISRSIAEAMGGTLSAASEPGKGSAFTLTLELPRARGMADESVAQARPVGGAERLADAPKVLLAEDHPTNRKVVSLILEAVGVDLTVVENGLAAVEAAKVEAFDVILMDMQMPVMDGLEAIREIRAFERASGRARTPILALTANAMAEHAKASADAGADGHLSKPIAAARLVEAVRGACELGEAAAAARVG
ncbi:MAG TPA: ATP-binding protein [Caulobacteraceae bacterium]|nr:ATP-binding protein [Caulobacteraceae bacterium]